MIVTNIGYLNVEQVKELISSKAVFSIYKTNKNTEVLVKETTYKTEELYTHREDRLPYKLVENRRIVKCTQVFNSKTDDVTMLDVSKWNNGNQIMSYEPFKLFY